MKYLLLIVTIVASVNVIGQTGQTARKFDELSIEEGSYAEINRTVDDRIKRFVETAKLRRAQVAYLIHYRSLVRQGHTFWNRSSEWSARAKGALAAIDRASDVFVVDGGVRGLETLEMWLAPRTAVVPRATPTFARAESIDCPAIYISHDGLAFDRAKPIVFSASVYPSGGDTFNWTVSAGKIVSKSGWNPLELDVTEGDTKRVTVIVEVTGLSPICQNSAIATAEIGLSPRLIDEFGRIPNGDFRARLDTFLATLQNHPEMQGYAYIYGGRAERGRDATSRKRLLTSQLLFRRMDASRIKIVDAGYREDIATEFWLVPPGLQAPIPTPSVDPIFAEPGIRPTKRKGR